jgi:hypothetical protein
MQKKEDKNDTVHHKATQDQKMCPIPAGAELKRRIRSYPNATGNTPILTLLIGSKNQSLFLFFHLRLVLLLLMIIAAGGPSFLLLQQSLNRGTSSMIFKTLG